ncbi:MAG: hypothetical protein Q7U84_00585 [Polynucleobacter sp.]|nr:hypothetical protein [Polynucleobacter sp.]
MHSYNVSSRNDLGPSILGLVINIGAVIAQLWQEGYRYEVKMSRGFHPSFMRGT